jgi:hypothetical protein
VQEGTRAIHCDVCFKPRIRRNTRRLPHRQQDSKTFAVAYAGAIIDLKGDETTIDGKRVYDMPALDHEQAFGEVCKVVDAHPELWNRPSRDAVNFAVDELWKKSHEDARDVECSVDADQRTRRLR